MTIIRVSGREQGICVGFIEEGFEILCAKRRNVKPRDITSSGMYLALNVSIGID